jgi:hypothetical protein
MVAEDARRTRGKKHVERFALNFPPPVGKGFLVREARKTFLRPPRILSVLCASSLLKNLKTEGFFGSSAG